MKYTLYAALLVNYMACGAEGSVVIQSQGTHSPHSPETSSMRLQSLPNKIFTHTVSMAPHYVKSLYDLQHTPLLITSLSSPRAYETISFEQLSRSMADASAQVKKMDGDDDAPTQEQLR